jgi:hypothetical protein
MLLGAHVSADDTTRERHETVPRLMMCGTLVEATTMRVQDVMTKDVQTVTPAETPTQIWRQS